MVVVQWLQSAAQRLGRPGGKGRGADPHKDPGPQMVGERLDAVDSYWWILAGGINVPGFGAHVGASEGP